MLKKNIKIVLTGGGTAGHVLPHFALLSFYKKAAWEILYVGSSGVEKQLAEEQGLRFKVIKTGKLRRHFSFQNAIDIFLVSVGFLQSLFILLRERPQLVFSKGGYVSVPVAMAGWCLRIPVITHESDLTPGLATKIIAKVSKKILCAFPATLRYFPVGKAVCVGLPIRPELAHGSSSEGYTLCRFRAEDRRPVLLIMGGSQGALRINQAVEAVLENLLMDYRVIHVTGKGKQIAFSAEGYYQVEYASDSLKHFFAISDFVITRAGANSIFEMLSLKKPMLLIPLEVASRGDQVHNAEEFVAKNWALMLRETSLSPDLLIKGLKDLKAHSSSIIHSMEAFSTKDPAHSIFSILQSNVLKSL
jgi:UDP-N-acetylglucosamine--N-acetylmuramyl-(pentapeptide) pyrophosphoryl-undecaprenol N-acetylglucosamine transferase